jgi:hypothetical protein
MFSEESLVTINSPVAEIARTYDLRSAVRARKKKSRRRTTPAHIRKLSPRLQKEVAELVERYLAVFALGKTLKIGDRRRLIIRCKHIILKESRVYFNKALQALLEQTNDRQVSLGLLLANKDMKAHL